jgi:hypothetical protein
MEKWKLINLEKRFDRGGPEAFSAYETGLVFPAVVGMSFSTVEPRTIILFPTREDYESNPDPRHYINVCQSDEFGPVALPIIRPGNIGSELEIVFIADEHFPGGEGEWEVKFTEPSFKSWESEDED